MTQSRAPKCGIFPNIIKHRSHVCLAMVRLSSRDTRLLSLAPLSRHRRTCSAWTRDTWHVTRGIRCSDSPPRVRSLHCWRSWMDAWSQKEEGTSPPSRHCEPSPLQSKSWAVLMFPLCRWWQPETWRLQYVKCESMKHFAFWIMERTDLFLFCGKLVNCFKVV